MRYFAPRARSRPGRTPARPDTRVQNSRNSAFTLLEVVLAITILAGLSATVYQVVSGSVQSATLLEENQRQNDRVRTLFSIFRNTLQTIPGGASIEMEIVESEPLIQELTLVGVPNAFPVGANPASRGDTTIGIREQPLDQDNPDRGTLYTLAITREDFAPPEEEYYGLGLSIEADGIGGSSNSGVYSGGMPEDDFSADEEGRYWFPLLKNIRAIEWGIYDSDEELFMPEWNAEDGESLDRPKMIELNLLLEGWETPIRSVFTVADIPTTTKPTSLPEQTSPTPTGVGGVGGGPSTVPTPTPGGTDRPQDPKAGGGGDSKGGRGGSSRDGGQGNSGRGSGGGRPGSGPPGGPPSIPQPPQPGGGPSVPTPPSLPSVPSPR